MSARRSWAWPLAPLYAAGLAVKDMLIGAGVLKARQLEWPVVSIGSLSAGGAGKTPVVIALAELLSARGWTVDVLSRGYGRKGPEVQRVQPDAESAAERFGDEPVLITRRTGTPVWVGARRFDVGRLAESAAANHAHIEHPSAVHILDDGFQHRQLARTVDVVLVTEADLDDSLLPAGNLREPLSALRRANVVIVRQEEREHVLPRLKRHLPISAAVWTICRELSFATVEPPSSEAASGGYFAFCGIARPADFQRDLGQARIDVVETMMFPDHHRYTMEDMEKLTAASRRSSASVFVTTEKDAVKLSSTMRARLESHGQLAVARLEARFLDEDGVMRDLEARLR